MASASNSNNDFVKEFREYLERFEAEHGDTDFGAFVKHRGRLVKKLRYEEFEPMYREFHDMSKSYFESLDRGDTINDVVVKVLRQRAIELFVEPPA
jgi:hypothetical protein